MPRFVILAILWVTFFPGPLFALEPSKPLVMGLHPNVSARTLLTMYEPLRVFLEKELSQPVHLYTAADFKTYMDRTLGNEYDIAVTAPHLARLAQTKGRYVPMLNYTTELHGVIVVTKDSPINKPNELRGKTIAIPDPFTVISIMGLEFLRDQGLNPDKDIKLFAARSHNNAAIAVDHGEAQAAIIGSVPYKQLPEELKSRLRVIASTIAIPSQFIIASPKLSPPQTERIKTVLLKYADTSEGKKFLETNGFGGLRPATEPVLMQLDRYAQEVVRMLEKP